MYTRSMPKVPPPFLNGIPELLVLKLLSRQEMYGYEIVKTIQAQTGKRLTFGEGCIYPYLHYLEKEKLVSSRTQQVNGRDRYYYRLTAKGRARLESLSSEWNRVSSAVTLLMEDRYA
jgi:PadR family transcriptional regulator PadR